MSSERSPLWGALYLRGVRCTSMGCPDPPHIPAQFGLRIRELICSQIQAISSTWPLSAIKVVFGTPYPFISSLNWFRIRAGKSGPFGGHPRKGSL